MKKISGKNKKNRRLKKWVKVTIMLLGISLLLLIVIVGYKICNKYIFKDKSDDAVETVKKEELDLNNYNYYINSSASEYEKKLFNELKDILSKEEVNEEEYAKVLTKVFVADLFTLSSKNSSSDVPSSQYVYDSYRETFEIMVRDTIYSSVELNLNGNRNQVLPTVNNIDINSVERKSFSLNGKQLSEQAFYVKLSIKYKEDLGYPTNYEVVLVKNNELLQVVKAG